MNGRRFDEGNNLVSLPESHALTGLISDQGFERKATVETDAHHWSFAIHGPNVPEQTVARAALRRIGTSLLQHDVLGVDADIHGVVGPAIARGWRESNHLLSADLDGC